MFLIDKPVQNDNKRSGISEPEMKDTVDSREKLQQASRSSENDIKLFIAKPIRKSDPAVSVGGVASRKFHSLAIICRE